MYNCIYLHYICKKVYIHKKLSCLGGGYRGNVTHTYSTLWVLVGDEPVYTARLYS